MMNNGKIQIETSKTISRMHKKARQAIKAETCLLCGVEKSSFCNSHSVPRFVLSTIAHDGKVLTFRNIDSANTSNGEGINSVWTFHNICQECDSRVFQEYEDDTKITEFPTTKILAQIALKDDLMMLYKYSIDRAMDDDNEYNQVIAFGIDSKKEEDELNIQGEQWLMKRDKKILDKNLKSGYTCTFCTMLDYTVPIAFQAPLYIYKSIDNQTIINDIYDYSHDLIMKPLHVCVFPLCNKTAIYLFHHRDDRNYVVFDRQFQRLSFEEKLQCVNYLIIKYSEQWVCSPLIDKTVLADGNLKKLMGEQADFPNFFFSLEDNVDAINYTRVENVPNFLKMKHKN